MNSDQTEDVAGVEHRWLFSVVVAVPDCPVLTVLVPSLDRVDPGSEVGEAEEEPQEVV